MKENTFAHDECSRWISRVSSDGVVGIVTIKASENDFADVRFIVAIGVGEQYDVWFLGNIDTFWGKFEADGKMQFVSKNNFFIGFAIVVGVLVNENFVVRQSISRLIGGIGGHGCNPQASSVIKRKLHGVSEIGKFFLGSEKLDFVAFGNGQRSFCVFTILVFGIAIFSA